MEKRDHLPLTIEPSEVAKFLECDFNQCFTQMRRYEELIWDICKFTFTGYTAILGVAIGLYRFSIESKTNLTPSAVAVLAVGFLIGLCMFFLIVRNRVYFVRVTRYVNEHRAHFLRGNPLGFENKSGMYTDCTQPPYFRWNSSQMIVAYVVAFLNSILIAAIIYILGPTSTATLAVSMISLLLLAALQIVPAILFLKHLESKGNLLEMRHG